VDPTPIFQRNDAVFLPDGTLLQVHSVSRCVGDHCSIHNPSDHPLRDAPQLWDPRFKSIYRMCVHGNVHLDPDDLMFKWRVGVSVQVLALISVHDCDGCCHWPLNDLDDVRE
jgi:hypothetical protein